MIPQHLQNNEFSAVAAVYGYKQILAYLFGNYRAAIDYTAKAQPYLLGVAGMVTVPTFHLFASLAHLAESEIDLIQVASHQGTAAGMRDRLCRENTLNHHLIGTPIPESSVSDSRVSIKSAMLALVPIIKIGMSVP